MRTTLDIDDELMTALRERCPDASKKEAVETAIRGFLKEDAIRILRGLAGSMPEIDDSWDEMRHMEHF